MIDGGRITWNLCGMSGQRFIDTVVDNFCPRWFGRVVSVYIPGLRRTGSKPLRTLMAPALYCSVIICNAFIDKKLITLHLVY